MNKIFIKFGKTLVKVVEIIVGISLFIMAIGVIGFSLPAIQEKGWSGLGLTNFAFFWGAIVLISVAILIITGKPKNPILHLVAGLFQFFVFVGFLTALIPMFSEVFSKVSPPSNVPPFIDYDPLLVIIPVGIFGGVFLIGSVICFFRAYFLWHQRKLTPTKGGGS